MEKTATIPQAPVSVNADRMSAEMLQKKLYAGYEAAQNGRTSDAKEAFEQFRSCH